MYLVDRTILCFICSFKTAYVSLNQNEDQFAFSAVFSTTDPRWSYSNKVVLEGPYPLRIEDLHTKKHKTANKVKLEKITVDEKNYYDPTSWHKTPYIVRDRVEFDRLAKIIILKARQQNGSIDFETTEIKFKLDKTGKLLLYIKRKDSIHTD